MTRQRREVGLLGLVVIVLAVGALYAVWFAAQHTIPPVRTVITPTTITATTTTSVRVATVVCVTAGGYQFRTSPQIASAHHYHCTKENP